MLKKVCVPYQLVQEARDNAEWKTLCYWVWLNSKFHKKVFYNYSLRSIAKLLGVAPNTANHHIKRMIDMGWAHTHKGHLFLVKKEDFPNKSIIHIPVDETRKRQIILLRGILLNKHIFIQEKARDNKKEIVQKASSLYGKMTRKQIRFIRKSGGVAKLEVSINERTTLSNKTIGAIFSLSKRSGSRIQSEMNQMGLIKSDAVYEKVNVDYFNLPKNVFLHRDGIYRKRIANAIGVCPLL